MIPPERTIRRNRMIFALREVTRARGRYVSSQEWLSPDIGLNRWAIIREFGSWAAALEAAGLETRSRKGSQGTAREMRWVDRLADRVRAGERLYEVAATEQMSTHTLAKLFREWGLDPVRERVDLRGRAPQPRELLAEEKVKVVVQLWNGGMEAREIAQVLGIQQQRVHVYVRRALERGEDVRPGRGHRWGKIKPGPRRLGQGSRLVRDRHGKAMRG